MPIGTLTTEQREAALKLAERIQTNPFEIVGNTRGVGHGKWTPAERELSAHFLDLHAENCRLTIEIHQWEESDAAGIVFTDEIDRLHAENVKLRDALASVFCYTCHRYVKDKYLRSKECKTCLNLRAALSGSPDTEAGAKDGK